MPETIRILTVCTYNRTRSVLTEGLLGRHLAELGVDAELDSAGVIGGGHPATRQTIELLATHGIDASGHRSRELERWRIENADLIVCAERSHVIAVAGQHSGSFLRTHTLPEIVSGGRRHGGLAEAGGDLRTWLGRLATTRPDPLDYLDADHATVGEIDDPTGGSTAEWTVAFGRIDALCSRLAALLAPPASGTTVSSDTTFAAASDGDTSGSSGRPSRPGRPRP